MLGTPIVVVYLYRYQVSIVTGSQYKQTQMGTKKGREQTKGRNMGFLQRELYEH